MSSGQRGINSLRGRQRGVALAIVVWFVAGMSLLVAGIVSHARVDTKMTQLHLARAKTVAAGDGAILLAMAARAQGFDSAEGAPLVSESMYRLGDVDVRVKLYPASGFIDLNSAPAPVLAALFMVAGKTDGAEAQYLADSVVKWRTSGSTKQRSSHRFNALEDVLRVDGMSRTLLDSIRGYAVAGSWASRTTDWSAAPENMLGVLEAANPAQLDAVVRRRDSMMRSATSGSEGSGVKGTTFRADALVSYGGRTWLRRCWLTLESTNKSLLPWRIVRTEAPRVIGLALSENTDS